MTDTRDHSAPEAEKPSDMTLGRMFDVLVPETLKKALFTGAGMLFLTEEGIRKALGEFNLPRDAVNYLIKQSERGRDEFFMNLQRECGRFLNRTDVVGLIRKALDELSFDIHATVTVRTRKEDARGTAEGHRRKASTAGKKPKG